MLCESSSLFLILLIESSVSICDSSDENEDIHICESVNKKLDNTFFLSAFILSVLFGVHILISYSTLIHVACF